MINRIKSNVKEAIIEGIDGDPLSVLGFLSKRKRVGYILRAISFTSLTHITMGALGNIDIPWGSSSAFGIPHYRRLRETR